MGLKISDLTPIAANSLDGTEPVELGIPGDKNAPNGAFLPPGYIDGLKMQWDAVDGITVTSGAAYIQSLGRVVRAGADISKAGLALSASTWYHVYLYINAGTVDIEIANTAPDSPYNGTARSKTGDTSRRYLGSILTNVSGNIFNFSHGNSTIQYKANIIGAPFHALSSGTATSPTSVSLSGLVPITAVFALLSTTNTDPSVAVVFGTSDQGYVLSSGAWSSLLNPNSAAIGPYVIDASQSIQYMYRSARTGLADIRVTGYIFER